MKFKKEVEPHLLVSGRMPTNEEFEKISEAIQQAKATQKARKNTTGMKVTHKCK